MTLAVILPCAGKGTRLGLPYPKELHRISPTHSLIDFSLDHVVNAQEGLGVVTVITPDKRSVFDYVRSRMLPSQNVEMAHFNDAYQEWPGSILSAENHFQSSNIVLLPDSKIETHQNEALFSNFQRHFQQGSDLVFAYVEEVAHDRLTSLGALCVQNGDVTEFCDKPSLEEASKYNAFWAAFGFRGPIGKIVLEFMMRSVARESVSIQSLNLKVSGFSVKNYTDLGTWPSISRHIEKFGVK